MKYLLHILAACLISNAAQAAEKTCASLKHIKPTSSVSYSLPDPTFLRDGYDGMIIPEQQHQRWLEKNGLTKTTNAEKISAWGLFTIGRRISSKTFWVSRDFDKEANPRTSCIYLKDIHVLLTTDNLITIRDEFSPGTCKYKHIVDHEMRHYKAGEEVILELNQKLKVALPGLIEEAEKQSKPVPIKQEKEETQRVANILENIIWDFIRENSEKKLETANDEIDSLASYQAGWKLVADCEKH